MELEYCRRTEMDTSEDYSKDSSIALLKEQLIELKELLRQSESSKLQLQASYDKSLQELADSEAKRETAEKELKVAQDQMSVMWKELDVLHKRLDDSSSTYKDNNNAKTTSPDQLPTASTPQSSNNKEPLELCCTLCKVKIRLDQLDEHSKLCSANAKTPPTKKASKPPPTSSSPTHRSQSSKLSLPFRQFSTSPRLPRKQQKQHLSQISTEDRTTLKVNVTRTQTSESDIAPFKVVTRTTMPHFQKESYEVYRNAGDFQWLHDVLVEACPERVIPPLRSTISLDATVSEYQRFLYRLTCHRFLRVEQYFITFLTGTVEELRVLRAKFRPRLPSEDGYIFRPAQGRDTSSGALVATKEYLQNLERSISNLGQKLFPSHNDEEGSLSHWFWSIANGEPSNTYLKLASSDLARTCEALESHKAGSDGDDTLCEQNLQSIADYVHAAQELLLRVELAVDKFLFWDEEVTICEAVTSTPISSSDIGHSSLTSYQIDEIYDDSGVSSVSGSSTNSSSSAGDKLEGGGSSPMTDGHKHSLGEDSIGEKWAQASSNCADAKEYLEMMCKDLSEELTQFDLRKEQELKQVFLDMSNSQLEKNEKLQGKWYAMKCILDFPIKPEHRAINFVNNNS